MRVALVDSTKNPRYYPLALLKAASWLRERGDDCELFAYALPEKGKFDEIWITTLFTFDLPKAVAIADKAKTLARVVRVGGISASLLPDYFRDIGVEHWTLKMRNGFRQIANGYSAGNAINPSSAKEFETFFGKDAKEFIQLLNYPKIRELMALRRAKNRWGRAGIEMEAQDA